METEVRLHGPVADVHHRPPDLDALQSGNRGGMSESPKSTVGRGPRSMLQDPPRRGTKPRPFGSSYPGVPGPTPTSLPTLLYP